MSVAQLSSAQAGCADPSGYLHLAARSMENHAPLSWGQNEASHHFKSVLLICFVDRLPCLVFKFLIFHLRDRNREAEVSTGGKSF